MRSSLVLTAAFAIGAVAGPIEKRRVVTHVEIEVKTITVYVTAGDPQSTREDRPDGKDKGHWSHYDHHDWPKQSSDSSAPAPPAPEPTTETPTPAPSPEPAPPQPEPSSVEPSQAPEPLPTSDTPTPSEAPPTATQAPADGGRPTGEAQATLSSGPEYQAAMLYHHNAARANHGAEPLVWDSACEEGARRTAETCIFKHPDFLGELNQGQNLFTVSGDAFNATAGVTESWYKGELDAMIPYFGAADIPDNVFHNVGHLTAMLWKSTTKVGCVSIDCGGRMTLGDGTPTDMNKFTVCNYAEPGNFGGQYAENVAVPISTANLGSWSD